MSLAKAARVWRMLLALGLLVFVALSLPGSTEASFLTESKKLTASDAQADNRLGKSVSVSGDTLVVGGPYGGAGAAYVFQRDEGGTDNWGEMKKLTASDAQVTDVFGISVTVSGDTIVVGAEREDAGGNEAGAAYVFERNQGGADNWGEVRKLTASDAEAEDFFGRRVGISGDTVIVGAWEESAVDWHAGAAYVFQRDQGGADNWGEVKKLTASDAELGDKFGSSVTVSGDVAIVGAWLEDSGGSRAGAAYVFGRDEGGAGNWGEVKKLTASDAEEGDYFGTSAAINGDTVVVAGRYVYGRDGVVYVFQRDEGGTDNWGEVNKLIASDTQAIDDYGESVAVNGDTIVVGAKREVGGGAAYVFQRDQGATDNWGEVTKLASSDGQGGDELGQSVAVVGNTALIGAPNADVLETQAGAVYVFDLLGLKTTPTITLTPTIQPTSTTTPTPTSRPTKTPCAPQGCPTPSVDGPAMSLRVDASQQMDCPGGPQAGKVCVGHDLQFDVVVSADEIPPYGYTGAWAWINYGDELGDSTRSGSVKKFGFLWRDCKASMIKTGSSDNNGNANNDAAFAACRTGLIGAFDSFLKGALSSFTLTCTSGASSHLITLEVLGGPNAGTEGAQFSQGYTLDPIVPNHVDFIADSIDVTCLAATATPTHTPSPTPSPTPTITPTPTPKDPLADTDGDTIVNGDDPDDDNDGCTDIQELGMDETLGGRRYPHNPWDFYDVAVAGGTPGQDRLVDLFNDVVSVIDHYAPSGTEPEYDAWYDRGPSAGPNAWNMTAPDGKIDLFNDIVGVLSQALHDCR